MVSLLLDHGHSEATEYPIGMLWDEGDLVVERLNGQAITEAVLFQMAAGSLLSKDAAREFKKIVTGLNDGK
ncbi:tail protein [Achromobacter phage vB_AchrS_AchV4]|uniref:Tail protein n=1 Tax=Achromobacter phage vB_AchrS_AchV4 TaxID=2796514 RepID=A0A7T3PGZ3_9CAUD|nr:tail length tape measure protein [Achromobacter phage vB_AchrS_AchV4]QPZ53311.1 tail protein [Achromobacter phage vB_AchrS_AchV4]